MTAHEKKLRRDAANLVLKTATIGNGKRPSAAKVKHAVDQIMKAMEPGLALAAKQK